MTTLRGAKVYRKGRGFLPHDVCVKDGKIAAVGENIAGEDAIQIGGYLIPGMIDLHTHGYGGSDTMDGEDAVVRMSDAYAKRGVTAFLPTTNTASVEETAAAVAGIAAAMRSAKGARVLGAHVEGPFVDFGYRGAQIASSILPPTVGNLLELCGGHLDAVRMLTLAPELQGADAVIRFAVEKGICVSSGHTSATYEQTIAAIDAGVRQFTHLFNAMSPILHRSPGVPTAALTDDRVTAQLIADGVHTHPAILKMVGRLKPDGICLITDSMRAAGLDEGTYELGGQTVIVSGGQARLREGNLAGSVITMDEALRRMVRHSGLPLERVVPMTSEIPARALNLDDIGVIEAGMRADMCLLDENLAPIATWIGGESVEMTDRA